MATLSVPSGIRSPLSINISPPCRLSNKIMRWPLDVLGSLMGSVKVSDGID